MTLAEKIPKQHGTFEYFQTNRGKFSRDMKSIANVIGDMMEIHLRETSDKAIYLYSATEINKLMAKVRQVEKLYFGGQNK